MATERGLCGLAFGDEGEHDSLLSDMRARWPRARFVRTTAQFHLRSEDFLCTHLPWEVEPRKQLGRGGSSSELPSSLRHAVVDQGPASTARHSRRQYDLSRHCRARVHRPRLTRGRRRHRPQSDLARHSLPPRDRVVRRPYRLSLGIDCKRAAGAGIRPRRRIPVASFPTLASSARALAMSSSAPSGSLSPNFAKPRP